MDITAGEALTLVAFLATWGLFWIGITVFGHRALQRWKQRNDIGWELPPLVQALIGIAVIVAVAYLIRETVPLSLTWVIGGISLALLPAALRLERWVFRDQDA